MNATEIALRRIRGWFLVWFVVESLVGLAVAVYVTELLWQHAIIRHATAGATLRVTLISGIVVLVVLLGLALLLLEALLRRRPWARIVMLAVAWITVVGAGIDLLTVPGAAALVERSLGIGAAGWDAIQAASIATNTLDLLFWSWVIYTLQFAPALRGAFEGIEPHNGAGRN